MNSNYFLQSLLKRGLIFWILGSLVLCLGTCSFLEPNQAREVMIIQHVTGAIQVETTPGIKVNAFGKVTTYRKSNDYEFRKEIPFTNRSSATLVGRVRYRLGSNPKVLERMHSEYPHEEDLQQRLVGDAVTRAIKVTGSTMTSLESFSRISDLNNYIEDQARDGDYQVLQVVDTIIDPLTGQNTIIDRAKIVEDENGVRKRQKTSPLATYDVDLIQVVIDSVIYDSTTLRLFNEQAESSMKVASSKATSLLLEQEALQEQSRGKKDVARVEAEEAVKTAKAIAQAQRDSVTAFMALKAARLEAQVIKTNADAQAYAAKKVRVAGFTPQQQIHIDSINIVNMWAAYAKRNVPRFVGNSESSDPMDVIVYGYIGKALKDLESK